MEIKTKKHFNEIIKSLTEQILDEEDLTEFNTTASVGGQYMTPMAFTGGKKNKHKKSKKNSHRKKIGESIDEKDLKVIRKLIKVVVGDIFRDIWLRRATWIR